MSDEDTKVAVRAGLKVLVKRFALVVVIVAAGYAAIAGFAHFRHHNYFAIPAADPPAVTQTVAAEPAQPAVSPVVATNPPVPPKKVATKRERRAHAKAPLHVVQLGVRLLAHPPGRAGDRKAKPRGPLGEVRGRPGGGCGCRCRCSHWLVVLISLAN